MFSDCYCFHFMMAVKKNKKTQKTKGKDAAEEMEHDMNDLLRNNCPAISCVALVKFTQGPNGAQHTAP